MGQLQQQSLEHLEHLEHLEQRFPRWRPHTMRVDSVDTIAISSFSFSLPISSRSSPSLLSFFALLVLSTTFAFVIHCSCHAAIEDMNHTKDNTLRACMFILFFVYFEIWIEDAMVPMSACFFVFFPGGPSLFQSSTATFPSLLGIKIWRPACFSSSPSQSL